MKTTTTTAATVRNLAAFRAHFTMTANKLAACPADDVEQIEALCQKLADIEERATEAAFPSVTLN